MTETQAASTPTSTTATLRVEHDGPVATILLDNQSMRNAVTHAMWQQFVPVLSDLDRDETTKVVVVRGAGKHFSAGADISALREILHDPATGQSDGGSVTAAENALSDFRKPTIAAIDGYCVGGAWQIAGACDIRIASENAIFGITPAKIGIVYPLSGIKRLVSLVGPAAAKFLLFSGDFVNAEEALRFGMVARILDNQTYWEEIRQFAEHLALRSQFSTQAHKDLVNAIADGAPDLADRNDFWQREMALGVDSSAGIGAFLANETPQFPWLRPQLR
jgi:enoyl-CoA hydratase/carnithine racemase